MSEPGSAAAVGEYRDTWSVSSTLSNPGSAGGVSTQLSQVSDGSSGAVQTPGSGGQTVNSDLDDVSRVMNDYQNKSIYMIC